MGGGCLISLIIRLGFIGYWVAMQGWGVKKYTHTPLFTLIIKIGVGEAYCLAGNLRENRVKINFFGIFKNVLKTR